MGKFSERYKTNTSMEEDGVWVDFGDGIKVKVRRLNSKHSQETRRKLEKPYAGQYRTRDMPASLQEELMIKQLSQSIIVDWEGVEDPDTDVILPCTQENVTSIMTRLKDFREDVVTASMTQATFQDVSVAEAEGNSEPASNGK
jgi:Asp-tRNA(Asn)/Glu-tRNA(Gln) amidotransferase C subunit